MGSSKMSKVFSAYFFTFLIGSTLCLIPEGEYQIGPVFGAPANAAVNRLFGNKYFEAFFDKSQGIKPLLAKKVLLGVGAVGAGALAFGAAELYKKHHNQKGNGNKPAYYGGGGNEYYSQGQAASNGYYPATDYQYGQAQQQAYPSYNNYQDQSAYNYQDVSSNGYADQSSNGYTDQSSGYEYGNGGYSGYSR